MDRDPFDCREAYREAEVDHEGDQGEEDRDEDPIDRREAGEVADLEPFVVADDSIVLEDH